MTDFKIGEKAVYPAHGVAEVIGIEKKEINTTVCSFYVLKVLATGMQILVPKDKADQVGLRPVATSSEIEEVFDILREKDVHIDKQTWNRRYRGFIQRQAADRQGARGRQEVGGREGRAGAREGVRLSPGRREAY
jgi:CarD family transcriptional regulator